MVIFWTLWRDREGLLQTQDSSCWVFLVTMCNKKKKKRRFHSSEKNRKEKKRKTYYVDGFVHSRINDHPMSLSGDVCIEVNAGRLFVQFSLIGKRSQFIDWILNSSFFYKNEKLRPESAQSFKLCSFILVCNTY